jgi:hypothetical protein
MTLALDRKFFNLPVMIPQHAPDTNLSAVD